MRFLLLACLFLLLAGCAPLFTHPTKTKTEFSADSSSCEAMAGQAAGPRDAWDITRKRVYGRCMEGKGWIRQE